MNEKEQALKDLQDAKDFLLKVERSYLAKLAELGEAQKKYVAAQRRADELEL